LERADSVAEMNVVGAGLGVKYGIPVNCSIVTG